MKILPAIILLVANHFSTIVNVPSTLLGVLESTEKYRAKIFQDHFFQGTILYPSRWSLQNRQKHTKFKDTKIKTLRTAKNYQGYQNPPKNIGPKFSKTTFFKEPFSTPLGGPYRTDKNTQSSKIQRLRHSEQLKIQASTKPGSDWIGPTFVTRQMIKGQGLSNIRAS